MLGGGVYFIFKRHRLLEMISKRHIIYDEVIERKALYDRTVRNNLLGNTLRFYEFPEEFVLETLSKVDENLKNSPRYLPDMEQYYKDGPSVDLGF